MFAIEIAESFQAAHQLQLADGQMEDSHSHLWQVLLRVGSARLDSIDTVMDFHQLAHMLRNTVGQLADRDLGQTPVVAGGANPSAEKVAEWIARQVQRQLPTGVDLVFVRISEAENCWAIYQP